MFCRVYYFLDVCNDIPLAVNHITAFDSDFNDNNKIIIINQDT